MFIVWVLIFLCIGNVVAILTLLDKYLPRPFPKLRKPDHNDITGAVTDTIRNGMWRSSEGGRS